MITLNKLTTGYAKNGVLKEISTELQLEIKKGSLVGILGSNGTGKSTLIKTLAGFQKPLFGSVQIQGKTVHEMSPKQRAKSISVVLTERQFNGDLIGRELIQLGRQPHTNWRGKQTSEDREIVSQILKQLNIEQLADQMLKTMSDGEVQKILLARALAQQTPIVFLDEPSSHLDLFNKSLLFQEIKKIVKKEMKTVFFSSHDLNTAIQISDQIILLLNNQWEYGSPDELIEKGVFQNIFPKETILFDPKKKQFNICV
tara:strand:+ start:5431 stop:6201 length:771 start_codon:yes stop_codon:yes gene_type:complete